MTKLRMVDDCVGGLFGREFQVESDPVKISFGQSRVFIWVRVHVGPGSISFRSSYNLRVWELMVVLGILWVGEVVQQYSAL